MAITFPTTLDVLANPTAANYTTVVHHADQHSDANDAIEALEAKVGVDDSTVGTSLDFKIQKKPTDLKISTASKGGVFNGGFELGTGSQASAGWIGDEKYGWYHGLRGTTTASFDNTTSHNGSQSLKIVCATPDVGNIMLVSNTYYNGNLSALYQKYLISVKPSTVYKLSFWMKTTVATSDNQSGTGGAYGYVNTYDTAFTEQVGGDSVKVRTATDWTYYEKIFTSNSTAAYASVNLGLLYDSQTAWFDDIKLEEVVTDTTFTGKVAEKIRPVLQAVTSTDNIDQSLDPTGAYTNTYALTNAVNEGATHIQTFTPTKKYTTQIAVWCVAKGTGNWVLVVHTAGNVAVASKIIPNASLTEGAFNYFDVPNIWASGALHFHLYSSVADGTCKANTTDDLETASYIQRYAKKTESFSLIANGIKTELKADKDGLLSNAIIDLDNGKYRYKTTQTIGGGMIQGEIFNLLSATYSTVGLPWLIAGVYPNSGWYNYNSDFSIIFKCNFILPAKYATFDLTSYNKSSGGRYSNLYYSFDNITYVKCIDNSANDVGWVNVKSSPINMDGRNIVYLRADGVCSGTTANEYIKSLGIEADIDTSKIPQGLFYPLTINQFSETWGTQNTVLSYVYRQAKYTNEYGVVMPAIELNDGATGAGNAIGYIPLKIDNSQETTPAITILTSSGVASDTALNTDGAYVALSSGATEGVVNYTVTITKNALYLSSNGDSNDATQDPSHQGNFIFGVRQQGLLDRVKDVGNEIADIKQGVLAMVNNSPKVGYDAGTTDAYEITIPNFTGYYAGMSVLFKANTVNTGACTLNINGMGSKAIVKGITTALSNADILALMWCQCVYDGTNFVLLNPRAL